MFYAHFGHHLYMKTRFLVAMVSESISALPGSGTSWYCFLNPDSHEGIGKTMAAIPDIKGL